MLTQNHTQTALFSGYGGDHRGGSSAPRGGGCITGRWGGRGAESACRSEHEAGAGTRAKGRKAAKRATYPFINSQIISVANSGDFDRLVSTIANYLPDMNLVNISTAMHRLTKLTSSSPNCQAALNQHPVLQDLVTSARGALARSEATNASPPCQSLSNITWSLATLQFVDLELLQMAARLSHKLISSFKPFELSSTLWAFGKFESIDAAAVQCAVPLFEAAAELIPRNVEQFSFRCLVMTAWAFAAAKQHDVRLFRGIAAQMLTDVHTAQCQELANAAWAFSTAGVREDRLLMELSRKALRQLSEFKPQELCNMMSALADLGFYPEDFFVACARMAQSLDLQPPQLASVLWACSHIRPRHQATATLVMVLLPRVTQSIESFEPQELALVALAVAKCCGKSVSGDLYEASPPSQGAGFSGLPPQAVEFFSTALPWVTPRLHYFSPQSLADIVTSYLAVSIGAHSSLFTAMSHEVFQRRQTFEHSVLLLLLRNLPIAPRNLCGASVCALFAEAGRRLETLPPRELQVLSQLCTSMLGSSRDGALQGPELAAACTTLSQEETWQSPAVWGLLLPEAVVFDVVGTDRATRADNPAADSSHSTMSRTSRGVADAGRGGHTNSRSSATKGFALGRAAAAGGFAPPGNFSCPGLLGVVPPAMQRSVYQWCGACGTCGTFPGGKCACGGWTTAFGPGGTLTALSIPMPSAEVGSRGDCGIGNGQHDAQQGAGLAASRDSRLGPCPNVSVKNTFLEVSEQPCDEQQALAKPLPPPLEIIPPSVPAWQLEAYRVGYQKFRAGDAVGAKGELSTVGALDLAEPMLLQPWRMQEQGATLVSAQNSSGTEGTSTGSRGETSQPTTVSGSLRSSSAKRGKRTFSTEEELPPPLGFMPKFIDMEKLATFRLDYQNFRAGNSNGAKGEITQTAVPAKESNVSHELDVGLLKTLPPPLMIIPADVSPGKLAQYRVDYQKFRAGEANGAKGEVCNVLEGMSPDGVHAKKLEF